MTLRVQVSLLTPVADYFERSREDFMDSPYHYMVKVKVLTYYAKISRRSYLVRFRDSPPQFIAAPGSTEVRTFRPTSQERRAVYIKTGIIPTTVTPRRWRMADKVLSRLRWGPPFYHYPPSTVIDLTGTTLRGAKFTQGRGLMGHNFHILLLEEFGRWPGDPARLAGRGYSWTHDREVLIQMPTHFAAAPTVMEEMSRPEGGMVLKLRTTVEDFV